MRLLKSIFNFYLLLIILNSCGTLKEAGDILKNEKTKSSDEFLIEKKGPLTQPPDFQNIPEPGITNSKAENQNSIEEMINKKQDQSDKTSKSTSSTENSILEQIKK
jgi:hypothetical protein